MSIPPIQPSAATAASTAAAAAAPTFALTIEPGAHLAIFQAIRRQLDISKQHAGDAKFDEVMASSPILEHLRRGEELMGSAVEDTVSITEEVATDFVNVLHMLQKLNPNLLRQIKIKQESPKKEVAASTGSTASTAAATVSTAATALVTAAPSTATASVVAAAPVSTPTAAASATAAPTATSALSFEEAQKLKKQLREVQDRVNRNEISRAE